MLPHRLCAQPSLPISLWPLAVRGHSLTAAGHHRFLTTMRSVPYTNVFELAADWPAACASAGQDTNTIRRVLQIASDEAHCRLSDGLKAKYGAVLASQLVVSFTNIVTHEQAWFNAARSRKPQTFAVGEIRSTFDAVAALDTTGGPAGGCDFCHWETRTAEDVFGRIEMGNVVSASNLFKYCAPAHGLLLFKHHDPLAFTAADVQQLLLAGSRWFDAAAAAAVARGSDGSVMHSGKDSDTVLPADSMSTAASSERTLQPMQQASRRLWPLLLWNNLPRAGASQFHGHAQTALSEVPFPADLDMMQAAASYEAQHCGACYYDDIWRAHAALGLALQCGPPEDRAHIYASLTPRKDAEMVIYGRSLTSPSLAIALHAALRVLVDDLECPSFNAAVQPMWDAPTRISMASQPFSSCKVMARVVSRGKITSKSSDVGALEVFAGASIGHTDPHTVHAAISTRLSAMGDSADCQA